jgi:hypothetical protein
MEKARSSQYEKSGRQESDGTTKRGIFLAGHGKSGLLIKQFDIIKKSVIFYNSDLVFQSQTFLRVSCFFAIGITGIYRFEVSAIWAVRRIEPYGPRPGGAW